MPTVNSRISTPVGDESNWSSDRKRDLIELVHLSGHRIPTPTLEEPASLNSRTSRGRTFYATYNRLKRQAIRCGADRDARLSVLPEDAATGAATMNKAWPCFPGGLTAMYAEIARQDMRTPVPLYISETCYSGDRASIIFEAPIPWSS